MSGGFTMCVACYGVNGEHEYSNCVYAPPPDPLATLRAEVERLRDEAARSPLINTRGLGAVVAKSRVSAFSEVLDLIDKQLREGE